MGVWINVVRFYRQMARKLAANLRSLHSKKATIPTDDDDLSDSGTNLIVIYWD